MVIFCTNTEDISITEKTLPFPPENLLKKYCLNVN